MNHADYRHMVQAQQDAYMQAWQYITANWMCKEWQSVPDRIRLMLRLPASIGMCNGSLVTRIGAKGMSEFIARINSKKL